MPWKHIPRPSIVTEEQQGEITSWEGAEGAGGSGRFICGTFACGYCSLMLVYGISSFVYCSWYGLALPELARREAVLQCPTIQSCWKVLSRRQGLEKYRSHWKWRLSFLVLRKWQTVVVEEVSMEDGKGTVRWKRMEPLGNMVGTHDEGFENSWRIFKRLREGREEGSKESWDGQGLNRVQRFQ